MEDENGTVREVIIKPPPWEITPPPDLAPTCNLDSSGHIQFPLITHKKEARNICATNCSGKKLRGLIETRGGAPPLETWNGLGGILAKLVKLPCPQRRSINGSDGRTDCGGENWFQLDLEEFIGGIQMGVASGSGLLWSVWDDPELSGNQEGNFRQQFYAYSPIDFHLKVVSSRPTKGKLIKSAVLDNGFFIMLNQANQIQAFDLLQRKMTNFLTLDASSVSGFTDFAVMEEERQILLLKNDDADDLESIVIFGYPPGWNIVSIIHFKNMHIELTIEHSTCFIFQNIMHLTVSTWGDVHKKAIPVPVTSKSPNFYLTVEKEFMMPSLPPSNIHVHMRAPTAKYLSVNPPMLYTEARNGLDFYSLLPSSSKDRPATPVYRLRAEDGHLGDDYTRATAFPDNSSRILITRKMVNSYRVITFQKTANGTVEGVESTPFDDFTTIRRGDLITGNYTIKRQKNVLAMAFCKSINLLAVLFGQSDRFNVNIYDPALPNIPMVKAYPVVKRVTSEQYKVDSISKVSLSFEPDLIVVEFAFTYDMFVDDDTFTEFYCYPMLFESF